MPKLKAKRKTVKKLERTITDGLNPEKVLFYERSAKFTSVIEPAEPINFKLFFKKNSKKFILNPYSAVFVLLLAFIFVQFSFPAFSLMNKTKVWQDKIDWQEWQLDNLKINTEGDLQLASFTADNQEQEEGISQPTPAQVVDQPPEQPEVIVGQEQEPTTTLEIIYQEEEQESITTPTTTLEMILPPGFPTTTPITTEDLNEILNPSSAEASEDRQVQDDNSEEEGIILGGEYEGEKIEEEQEEENQELTIALATTTSSITPEIIIQDEEDASKEPIYKYTGVAKTSFTPEQGENQLWINYKIRTENLDKNLIEVSFSNNNEFFITDIEELEPGETLYIKIVFKGTGETTPIVKSFRLLYQNESEALENADEVLDDEILLQVDLSDEKKLELQEKLDGFKIDENEDPTGRDQFSNRFYVKKGKDKYSVERGQLVTDDNRDNESIYKTQIHTEPVNYLDEDGNWQPIDNSFVVLDSEDVENEGDVEEESDFEISMIGNNEIATSSSTPPSDEALLNSHCEPECNEGEAIPQESAFKYATIQNAWQTFFPQYANQPYRIQNTDRIIEYQILNANPNSQAQVVNNQITYPEVYPNVDYVYTITNEKVKEDIVIKAPRDSSQYHFQMKIENVYFEKDESTGNVNFYDNSTNELVWDIVDPFGYDFIGQTDPVYMDITQQDDNTYLITIRGDDNFTYHDPNIIFPVIIDPTSTVYATGASYDDGFITKTGASTYAINNGGTNNAKAGVYSDDSETYRAFYDFDISGLPDSLTAGDVTDVVVNIRRNVLTGTPTHDIFHMAQTADSYGSDYQGIFDDAGAGNQYFTDNTNTFQTAGWRTLDLGTNADSDLFDQLDDDFFSIGIANVQTMGEHHVTLYTEEGTSDAYLEVTWTFPSPCTDFIFSGNTTINQDITCTGTITIDSGATLTMSGNRTITAGDLVLNNGNINYASSGEKATTTLTVTNDITLSNGSDITSNLSATADNITVNTGCTISANGLGYAKDTGPGYGGDGSTIFGIHLGGGGGGYGGTGGGHELWWIGNPGVSNGLNDTITTLGSGGGDGSSASGAGTGADGSPGGGLIILTLTGTLTNSGTISSNGTAGVNTATDDTGAGGGGSGGGVNITTPNLAGSGSFTADGGNGGDNTGSGNDIGGEGGGGGRIYILNSSTDTYSGTYTADGGTYGSSASGAASVARSGADGTVGVYDSVNDDIDIYGGWHWNSDEDLTYRNVTITNAPSVKTTTTADVVFSGTLSMATSTWTILTGITPTITADTLTMHKSQFTHNGTAEKSTTTLSITNDALLAYYSTTTGNLNFTADNIIIEDTSALSANGKGYAAETGPGRGYTWTNYGDFYFGGGGGGHGGFGGNAWLAQEVFYIYEYYGKVNGINNVTTLGSGGAQGSNGGGVGAAAGGLIVINTTDTLTNDGTISADGANGTSTGTADQGGGGGGSGGGVNITAPTFAGSGSITAEGGDGGNQTNSDNDQGGASGGGGRIYVSYSTAKTYSGTYSAATGTPGDDSTDRGTTGVTGNDGTIGVYDSTNDDIYIEDGWTWNTDEDLSYRDLTIANASFVRNTTTVTINISGTMTISTSTWNFTAGTARDIRTTINADTLRINNSDLTQPVIGEQTTTTLNVVGDITISTNSTTTSNLDITADTFTLEDTCHLNASGYGYVKETGPGAGGQGGEIAGWNIEFGGGGGGYGGNGGFGGPIGFSFYSGPANGVTTTPATLGSGGGDGFDETGLGATGGGLVVLNIADTYTNSGTIQVNGNDGTNATANNDGGGGGGSGGGIYIRTNTIAGSGNLLAIGGDGGNAIGGDNTGGGGGGSGGRISTLECTDSYTGSRTVTGGTGGTSNTENYEGGNGVSDSTNNDTTYCMPTGNFNTGAGEDTDTGQKVDGTGTVDISMECDDPNDSDMKAKLEYCSGVCPGCSSWTALSNISGTEADADFKDAGPALPDIDNVEAYQIGTGTGTRIVSSATSTNTVWFDWDMATQLGTVDGTYCLRLTVNNDTDDQAVPHRTQLTFDTTNPTVGSLAVSDPSSAHYTDGSSDDWYRQATTTPYVMGFESVPSDTNTINTCLWDWDHSDGTSYDYNDSDFALGTDGDLTAANMTSGGIDLSDDTDGTISLDVGCVDEYGNSATSTITFDFDSTGPAGLDDTVVTANGTIAIDVAWTAATDTNFEHYEIWYDTDQDAIENRRSTTTALEWDDSNDPTLTTATTATTGPISGLSNIETYYVKVWARDQLLNETFDDTITFAFSECGDAVIEGLETCEPGVEPYPQSCQTLGWDNGVIDCYAVGHASECQFDTSPCYNDGPDPGDDLEISGISVENIQATMADIVWTTSLSANSSVDYGLTRSYGLIEEDLDTYLISHRITLTNLTSQSEYNYRVSSETVEYDSAMSGNYSFEARDCDNTENRTCGPPEAGIGECRSSTEYCTNGWWPGTCPGAVYPIIEDCTNTRDDDCDDLTSNRRRRS